jgi:multimeric flavodoxin WrbA
MKRVTAFVGSAHKGHTHDAVTRFLGNLQSMGDIEVEIVRLSDYRVEVCRGCRLCLDKGEAKCPHKDDRDVLIEKMMGSDGVIFATPNYSFQVSGIMKVFLDRLGFAFHRPRFFGKTFTSIVTEGIYGGSKILGYLDFVGGALGFNTVKGSCVNTRGPITEEQQDKIDRVLAAHARRYYVRLQKPAYPAPRWFNLFMFRWGRTAMGLELDESCIDYRYFRDKGWFESDYYYPTHLDPLRKGVGKLVDSLFTGIAKKK